VELAGYPLSLYSMRRAPKISKLSDEFGNYRLSILCLRCGNERICEPGVIAAKVGWDCSLDGLGQRLKCGKCGAKVAKIEALPGIYRRPEKWH
jgi:hypothetical protein